MPAPPTGLSTEAQIEIAKEQALTKDLREQFAGMPVASFAVAGTRYAVPILSVNETGANRIIERERAYRDGAKLDDTGSKAKRWAVEVMFNNSIVEPGLESNGAQLYPDVLNGLIAAFDEHLTGDLVLPTRGKVRARALDYARAERFDQRDTAVVTFNFVEDNEDSVDFRSLQPASAAATGRRIALNTEFDAQAVETWDLNVRELNRLTSEIETTLNKPQEIADNTELLATQVMHAAQRVEHAFSKAGRPGRDQLNDHRGHKVQRKLVVQRDLAGHARLNSRAGRPTYISVVAQADTSLFAVAAFLGQPLEALLGLNPQLEDPLYVRRGTVLKVLPDAQAA